MQRELSRRLNGQLLAETGVSEPEYTIMARLSEAPGGRLRIFELRRAVEWEKTRLTHQITRMTQRGLLERQPFADDPRGAYVALTEAGRELICAAAPAHVTHVRRWLLDALTPEQQAALDGIAEAVLAKLSDDDPDSTVEEAG